MKGRESVFGLGFKGVIYGGDLTASLIDEGFVLLILGCEEVIGNRLYPRVLEYVWTTVQFVVRTSFGLAKYHWASLRSR